jgi:hypothetical protein
MNNGYYQVGSQQFSNKLLALIEGTKTNTFPQWVFNNDIFDAVEWTIAPVKNIVTLYQERAQRLRDRHSRVVLLYSGGVDSQNVFDSFVSQGLVIDEIITLWPVQAADQYHGNPNDRSSENCISEWTYLIRPQLEYIKQNYPAIKITVLDSTVDIATANYSETDFFEFDHFHSVAGLSRWSMLIRTMQQIAEAHPNTVFITGTDKPKLRYKDQSLYVYFLDFMTYLKSTNSVNIEYFYWNPDSIDIMRKQCHLIFDFFRTNPHLQPLLVDSSDMLLQIVNTCIYPGYNPARFQVSKQQYVIFSEQQKWTENLTQFQTGNYQDRWNWQLNNLNQAVNDKYKQYKNGLFDGYFGAITPFYLIGKFDQKIISTV